MVFMVALSWVVVSALVELPLRDLCSIYVVLFHSQG